MSLGKDSKVAPAPLPMVPDSFLVRYLALSSISSVPMSRMNRNKQIRSIVNSALFSFKYNKGLNALKRLRPEARMNQAYLSALGIIYDHLALKSKGHYKRIYNESARKQYKELIRLFPNNPSGYWGLGRIALQHKRWKQAINYYEQARRLKPRWRSTHLALAHAYSWSGKFNEARKIYLYDWKRRGPSFSVAYNLALLEDRAGRKTSSRKFASHALRSLKRKRISIRNQPGYKLWERRLTAIVEG